MISMDQKTFQRILNEELTLARLLKIQEQKRLTEAASQQLAVKINKLRSNRR